MPPLKNVRIILAVRGICMEAVGTIGRWTWLRILAAGWILFVLLERVMMSTHSIMFVPALLMVGTFTVPIAFCAFLYSRVRTPDVSWLTLIWCFIWGGALGTIIAGYLEYDVLLRLGALPAAMIGLIEEAAKLVVPLYFLLRHRHYSEFDAIVIGASVGAGFAALESMGYGFVALLLSGGNINTTDQVLLFRSLMAPAAHIAWTGLLSGALWQALRTDRRHKTRQLLLTFVGVVILHTLWDSVGILLGYIVLGVISLGWLLARTHQAEQYVRQV